MIYAGGILLLSIFSLTYSPLGQWLQASMVTLVLIQIPCLVLAGYIFGHRYLKNNRYLLLINDMGIAGMLLCVLVGGYWMVPLALDASLAEPLIAFARYVSLPALVGIPLAVSWGKINSIARAVIKIELLAMLYRLGWLYLVSPNRLCNFYQTDEQVLLGKFFLVIAVTLSVYWLFELFFRDYRETGKAKNSMYIMPKSG
ncbi:MAG: hypothetical protein GY820_27265 [Gammaproteobacteria bacterium]|nr:hypothetical protein [Gammaproteobacteria bacterium]